MTRRVRLDLDLKPHTFFSLSLSLVSSFEFCFVKEFVWKGGKGKREKGKAPRRPRPNFHLYGLAEVSVIRLFDS